ncbi:hypothetical protein R1flu_026739 [Riccia fluitans]|uniref:Uncharacterized protein n=1 Tax=Riccia fluitans TaxID=41844 RepID=A0ABD1XGV2_9MARC
MGAAGGGKAIIAVGKRDNALAESVSVIRIKGRLQQVEEENRRLRTVQVVEVTEPIQAEFEGAEAISAASDRHEPARTGPASHEAASQSGVQVPATSNPFAADRQGVRPTGEEVVQLIVAEAVPLPDVAEGAMT